MHEIAGLLAKLKRIAGRQCCGDERSAHAVALVNAFSTTLYARLGIEALNRPTRSAKSIADQTLVELRQQILAVETRRREPLRTAFTAARHRVEMERRVLAGRMVAECEPPALAPSDVVARPRRGTVSPPPSLDRQFLTALRRRLGQREQVARSRAAIEDSLRLLELYTWGAIRGEPPASAGR